MQDALRHAAVGDIRRKAVGRDQLPRRDVVRLRERSVELPLLREVVDGVDAAGARPRVRVVRCEAREQQRRVPVLRVYGVRPEAEMRRAREQRIAEEEEALLVVVEAVHVRPAEVTRVLQQVHGRAAHVGLPDVDALVAAGPGHLHGVEQVREVERRALDGAVHRHRDAHVVAVRPQRVRQRASDVAEPADFRERAHLNSGKQDVQYGIPVGVVCVMYV